MKRFNANAFRFTAAAQIDQRACDAAAQGPDELRRFIQRVQGIASLSFSDYMTDAQVFAWRKANAPTRTAEVNRAGTEAPKR